MPEETAETEAAKTEESRGDGVKEESVFEKEMKKNLVNLPLLLLRRGEVPREL